jgi:hypothetical protein
MAGLVLAFGVGRASAQVVDTLIDETWENGDLAVTPGLVDGAAFNVSGDPLRGDQTNPSHWYQGLGTAGPTGFIPGGNHHWQYRHEGDSGPSVGWTMAGPTGTAWGKTADGVPGTGAGNDIEIFAHFGRNLPMLTVTSFTLSFNVLFSQGGADGQRELFAAIRQGGSSSTEANPNAGVNANILGIEISNDTAETYDVLIFGRGGGGARLNTEHVQGAAATDKTGQNLLVTVTFTPNLASLSTDYTFSVVGSPFSFSGSGSVSAIPLVLDNLYFALENNAVATVDNIELTTTSPSGLPPPPTPVGPNNHVVMLFQDYYDPLKDTSKVTPVFAPVGVDGTISNGLNYSSGILDSFPESLTALDTFERPSVGLDGFVWGAYNAAKASGVGGETGTDRDIAYFSLLAPGHAGIDLRDYSARAQEAGGGSHIEDTTWGAPIDKTNGSYYYTIFNRATRHPGGSPRDLGFAPDFIDMTQGGAAFFLAGDVSDPFDEVGNFIVPNNDWNASILIQTGAIPGDPSSGQWFRSTTQVTIVDNTFNVLADNSQLPEYQDLFQSFPIAGLSWERVSAAAEADMNQLDMAGEVPLGATQAGAPDLTQVTGFGILGSTLIPASEARGAVLAVEITGVTGTPLPTPTPSPTPQSFTIASETWDMVSGFSPAGLPDGPAVVDSDLSWAAHAGGVDLANIEFVTLTGTNGTNIKMRRAAAGTTAGETEGIDLAELGAIFKADNSDPDFLSEHPSHPSAPPDPPLRGDTLEEIRINALIYYGQATATATTGTLLTLGIGDDVGGDYVTAAGDNLVPGSMIGGASLSITTDNAVGAPRLVARFNDPFGGTLSVDPGTSFGMNASFLKAGEVAYDTQNATAWNDGATGHEYFVEAHFVRGDRQMTIPGLGPYDTVVRFTIAPNTGGPIDSGGETAGVVATTGFPLTRTLNQAFIRVGGGFGNGGADGGSWVDDINFIGKGVGGNPLPVEHYTWMLYDNPPPGW